MAAQRTPLGHKGRGEAAAAFGGTRTLRQRFARGMRQAHAAKIAVGGQVPGVTYAMGQAYRPTGAFSGVRTFQPRNSGLPGFHN